MGTFIDTILNALGHFIWIPLLNDLCQCEIIFIEIYVNTGVH